jgi:hypothetical protein
MPDLNQTVLDLQQQVADLKAQMAEKKASRLHHLTLPRFSGDDSTESYEEFMLAYNDVANANSWTDEMCTNYFPLALHGTAQALYRSLSQADKEDFTKLKKAMGSYYATQVTPEKAREDFTALKQLECESLPIFLQRLRQLAPQAYPNFGGWTDTQRQQLVLERFRAGLKADLYAVIARLPAEANANLELARALREEHHLLNAKKRADDAAASVTTAEAVRRLTEELAVIKAQVNAVQAPFHDDFHNGQTTWDNSQQYWDDTQPPEPQPWEDSQDVPYYDDAQNFSSHNRRYRSNRGRVNQRSNQNFHDDWHDDDEYYSESDFDDDNEQNEWHDDNPREHRRSNGSRHISFPLMNVVAVTIMCFAMLPSASAAVQYNLHSSSEEFPASLYSLTSTLTGDMGLIHFLLTVVAMHFLKPTTTDTLNLQKTQLQLTGTFADESSFKRGSRTLAHFTHQKPNDSNAPSTDAPDSQRTHSFL